MREIITALLTVACLSPGWNGSASLAAGAVERSSPIPVLCLYSEDLRQQGLDGIDPKALAFYRSKGFDLHVGAYQTTDAKTLARYPVVIGMMPMLYAGTRAIGESLGADLERYVRAGGGFALIPAPSYYGGDDFARQLNPWLGTFGAELLNEPPRDPAHQRAINRVINYRYLSTTNLAAHPVTAGLRRLWLPLDYTDAYVLTHTMRVSQDWQVLVRGNPTCASHPLRELGAGRAMPGAYASAPPFLAVRSWGEGRLALFTTSSQYFVFDAYHWAFGDGFVMKEGGEQLMTGLLAWLAQNARPQAAEPAPVAPSTAAVTGNVPLCRDKESWFREVQRRFSPRNFSARAYVDCGALSDLPYSRTRGGGWIAEDAWPVRWTWSEVFHPTAANARGFREKPLTYRFDGLGKVGACRLGLLLWAYSDASARSVQVKAGATVLAQAVAVPRFSDKQGPAFVLLDIPRSAIGRDGSLDVSFTMADGGTGDSAAVCELWLFQTGSRPRQNVDPRTTAQAPPRGVLSEPPSRLRPYRGLIGAQSTISGSDATVAELGRAAREAGYDFLAFTEDAQRLDETGLAALRQACAEASDTSFVCLPGLRFSAQRRDAAVRADQPTSWGPVDGYVFQHVAALPGAADYGDPHRLFWRFFGGDLAGGRSAPVTLSTPLANAVSPFHRRFWRGFDVFTLSEVGAPSEDARDLYADLVASGYGPVPRLSGAFRSAESIRNAATNGWAVTIFADSLARLEAFHYTSSVGNGPRFHDYRYSSDYEISGNPGEGLLFTDTAWIVLHADIESPSAIERVTLFSGREPLRTWYPNQTRIRIQEPFRVARNHELWMSVQSANGAVACTGRYLAEDRTFMAAMCADNQNTICSVARAPDAFVQDDRDLYLSHSYWHTGESAGQLGALRRMRDIVPRVSETGIVQPVKLFLPSPALRFDDGSTEDHRSAELRVLGASSDYNQIEYRFDTPESRARSSVLLTSFRPAPSGATVVLVEVELTAKTDLQFPTDSPGLQNLDIAPLRDLAPAWNYTYRPVGGEPVSRPFDYARADWSLADRLDPDSGVLLWPSDVGSLLILPLDGVAYDLKLSLLPSGTGRERAQLLTRPARLAAGQTLRSRILVVLHQGAITSGDALETLRRQYANAAVCLQNLHQGRLVDATFALTIEAAQNGMRARLDTRGRSEPLPVILEGVNPRWPCAWVQGAALRLLEANDHRLRFVVPPELKETDTFAGNLVLSDQAELRIEWAGVENGKTSLHLHNPTPRSLKAHVWTSPGLDASLAPPVDAHWVVPPGASLWTRGNEARAE